MSKTFQPSHIPAYAVVALAVVATVVVVGLPTVSLEAKLTTAYVLFMLSLLVLLVGRRSR